MWPQHAAAGRPRRSNLASWVECKMVPNGVWMAMGSAVGHLLQIGVDREKKCVVQPKLAMA